MNDVYKINDVINCEFLKLPKAMFATERYKGLSSDAKLTYALLYDRLSLSKLNGWINETDEVYLIYTRQEIADNLGLTYKKAIQAFKELISAGLIRETRSGRGMPNRIYVAKIDLTPGQAKEYVKEEQNKICQNSTSKPEAASEELPNEHIKTCQNGISRTAETAHQELPNRHTNKTNINNTEINKTDNSKKEDVKYIFNFCQSVSHNSDCEQRDRQDRTDAENSQYNLDDIFDLCGIDNFDSEEQIILRDAIERLYYSDGFRIGKCVFPQNKVRSRLYNLTPTVLQSVLDKLHQNTEKKIRNVSGYVAAIMYNEITEEYSLIHVDPYLNAMRNVRME